MKDIFISPLAARADLVALLQTDKEDDIISLAKVDSLC